MEFLFVALGGALGSMGRYAISLVPVKHGFPIPTLVINLLGAVLIGFVAGLAAERKEISPHAVVFWKTGVCGGFTTFSTFSLEAFTLLEHRQFAAGVAYIVLSVALCLAGILCGKRMAMLMA